ncbi:AcrR family transcriptional regulator [Litorivivens lipolytica]|uniref:AcrR family transcriptional regulator n=1 Tax=Litorivivens lipolytica TaxID=1524264 RepID=A0A7W4W1M9_9GAMM|nr:TetR/AcrR family transcriptional regulator [Litorivivens lipolytica]MBB3045821.1 AcrR family transcriptional regulator [Litorivivens lipolytica]
MEETDTAKMDGRSTRHEARRQEILEKATAYLLQHGLTNLAIRPMAEALGISHRTLLHHFGSKDEMIQTILGSIQQQEVERGEKRAADFANDPLGMLDDSWAQLSSANYLGFLRMSMEASGKIASPGGAPNMADGTRQYLKTLTEAIKSQGVAPKRASQLATLARGTMSGLTLDMMVTGDKDRVRLAYRGLRDWIEQEINDP